MPFNGAHFISLADFEAPVLNPDVISAISQDAIASPRRALSVSSTASTMTESFVGVDSECGDSNTTPDDSNSVADNLDDSDDSDSGATYDSNNSLYSVTFSTAGNDGSFISSEDDDGVSLAAAHSNASSIASSDTDNNLPSPDTANDSPLNTTANSFLTADRDYSAPSNNNVFVSPAAEVARTIYGPPTKRLRLAPPSISTRSEAQGAQTAAEPASTPEHTFAVPVEAKRRLRTRLLRFLSAEERKATIEALGP